MFLFSGIIVLFTQVECLRVERSLFKVWVFTWCRQLARTINNIIHYNVFDILITKKWYVTILLSWTLINYNKVIVVYGGAICQCIVTAHIFYEIEEKVNLLVKQIQCFTVRLILF